MKLLKSASKDGNVLNRRISPQGGFLFDPPRDFKLMKEIGSDSLRSGGSKMLV